MLFFPAICQAKDRHRPWCRWCRYIRHGQV